MTEIIFTDSDIAELRTIFFSEAGEILENLPKCIISIEESPEEDKWKELKRAFHTLKGDSKAMGFNSLSTLAHKVEDFIAYLKENKPDKTSIDLLFECIDAFKVFLNTIANGGNPDISDIISKIDAYRKDDKINPALSSFEKSENLPYPPLEHEGKGGFVKKFSGTPFLKIEPERVDMIMNLVGELVIGRSMLSEVTSEINKVYKDSFISRLASLNSSFERILTDLQRSVMKVRMLPVNLIFRRFPRVVRDLSSERSKKVKLMIIGENTELDKAVVDVIGEPLLHIIRNAIDHGIETPEERRIAGKTEEGLISLRAFHQGNQMVIEIEDDGRGIDIDKIKEKAILKSIINSDDGKRIGDKEAINLIFQSGFSTSEIVTEISGRGVGMDIVKDTVESLRGLIDITTEKGKGTKITLRLPLTLAIIKSILFAYKQETFAVPLASVTEIIRVSTKNMETIGGNPVLRHRDEIVPVISIDGTVINKKAFIIVIGVAHMRVGLLTEKIIGEEELVIKALDDKASAGLAAGASILGDGRVVLIIDTLYLIRRYKEQV